MQTNNTQYSIEPLINYYSSLIAVNNEFPDVQCGNDNYRYEDLVKQLVEIRQLIINKTLTKINSIYRPTMSLFNYKEHFIILEETIKFYKQNSDVDYTLPTTEPGNVIDNRNDLAGEGELCVNNKQTINNVDKTLATFGDKISAELSNIQELINKKFTNNDFNGAITKCSNDTLAALTNSYELLKADVARYDALLTEHISKSAIYIAEAIEKEHARFVQKIASDSNTIIAGITEATTTELGTQTNLIETRMKQLDDKLFKWFGVIFIIGVCTLFACSILSSTWAANKLIKNVRELKAVTPCSSVKSTITPKSKHY